MINVSKEFKELMEQRTDFKQYAEITLSDGTVLELDETHFTSTNNSIVDGAGLTAIPLGVAIQKHIQIEILNDYEQYSDYDFFGAKIRLFLTFRLSSTTERVNKGYYTATTPATYGDTVIITAVDDMYKADRAYETSLSFPASIRDVLIDACGACDIPLLTTSFKNDTFVLPTCPEGTFREVIGHIAQIACGNARIDNAGYLSVISYDISGFANGNYHTIGNFTYPKIETDNVIITGVQTTIRGETPEEDKVIMAGQKGYVVTIENPLIVGQEDIVLTWLYTALAGLIIRPFYGDIISNPLIEFMDLAMIVDRRGRAYKTVITDVNFQFFGYTTIKNSFENPIQNQVAYASSDTKAIQYARRLVETERSSRELAIEQLSKALANGSGMYETRVEQEDGSYIYYLHDKPTLEESKNVLKITSDAIGFSNDGGKTFPAGFTFNAEAVMRIIETEGLSAEWVKVESKTITDYIDESKTAANDYTDARVSLLKTSFDVTTGKISSTVSEMQTQVDQSIRDYYFPYEPTLENLPASEWTTEALKLQHEGDLFFDENTGYKYCFLKTWQANEVTYLTSDFDELYTDDDLLFMTADDDPALFDSEWGWVLIQDKDAVEALKKSTEIEQTVERITLRVTGEDGTVTDIVISDGTIELDGEVLAQYINVVKLLARDLITTGTVNLGNTWWKLFMEEGRLIIGNAVEGYVDGQQLLMDYGSKVMQFGAPNILVSANTGDLTLAALGLSGTVKLQGNVTVNNTPLYPRLSPSYEYETLEKWNGETVYAMLVDMGTSENEKAVATEIPSSAKIKRIEGSMGTFCIPRINGTYEDSGSAWVIDALTTVDGVTKKALKMFCGSAMTGLDTEVTAYYVK